MLFGKIMKKMDVPLRSLVDKKMKKIMKKFMKKKMVKKRYAQSVFKALRAVRI